MSPESDPRNSTRRSRTGLVWLVVVAVIAAGFVLRRTVFAPDPIEVRVERVARGRVEATVTNSKAGTVEARRRSRIASEIGGQVVEIAHREGERVPAGEPLVRLSPRSQEAQLELAVQGVAIAEAGLEDACLRRDRARRELARTERLAESSVASADRLDELQYRFDSARVACDGARAELARAEAQRASAETELAKTVITAPFAGIVAEVNVELGEWVTPSPPLLTSPPVIDLIDPGSIFVSAPMDEVDSGAIRPGLPVKVTVDSRPGETFRGSVLRVAPYVLDAEAQNRTLEIEVALEDAAVAESLLPGTSADAEVVLDARSDVIRVPTSALPRNERVLVLEDGELVEREIEVGLRNWQFAEVRTGLEGGEPIVVVLDRLEIVAGARAMADGESAPSREGVASGERDTGSEAERTSAIPDVGAGRDS
ncbi:MAG: efflux RND transporter periplasmic adaptor subunit [Myxococcota bacterium]